MAPGEVDSDRQLAIRARGGERRAFSRIVERHGPALAKAARGFGLPETDVDDVVQEAFLSAWRALDRYDADRPFRTWLFKIAVNKFRDVRRQRRVRSFLFNAIGLGETTGLDVLDDAPGPERTAIARRDLVQVKAIMAGLDAVTREVVTLHAMVGVSQADTAALLGLSIKTVETRMARARRKLAGLLQKDAGA